MRTVNADYMNRPCAVCKRPLYWTRTNAGTYWSKCHHHVAGTDGQYTTTTYRLRPVRYELTIEGE